MKIDTRFILQLLYIISWIIFVGLGIEAGAFLTQSVGMAILEPETAKRLWQQINLDALLAYDKGYFMVITLHICVGAILRAVLFYLIIRTLHNKHLSLSHPFRPEMGRFLFLLSYLSLFIGVVSFSGIGYSEWLVSKGVSMPDIRQMKFGGADVWMFMGITIFVIAQLFKRGIEMQAEHDLTV